MQASCRDHNGLVITTKFECGAGKNIKKTGRNRYRVQLDGDTKSYSDFFHVRLEGCRADASLAIDIGPDPVLSGFPYPSGWLGFPCPASDCIWLKKDGQAWQRFRNFTVNEKLRKMRIHLKNLPGGNYCLANMVPLPYSEMSKRLKDMAREKRPFCSLQAIGKSVQARPIYSMAITEKKGARRKPVVLVLAGQHAVEFPGQWATLGIMEFLLSAHESAARIRKSHVVVFIPQANPDGNVLARHCYNAQGENIYAGYKDAAKGKRSTIKESRAVWKHVRKIRPSAYLEFHGWESATDGGYAPHINRFKSAARKKTQLKLVKAMVARTAALDHFGYINSSACDDLLWNQIPARFNAPTFLYEPSMRHGTDGCKRTGVNVFTTLVNALSKK